MSPSESFWVLLIPEARLLGGRSARLSHRALPPGSLHEPESCRVLLPPPPTGRCRPESIYRKWTDRVMEEFYDQVLVLSGSSV